MRVQSATATVAVQFLDRATICFQHSLCRFVHALKQAFGHACFEENDILRRTHMWSAHILRAVRRHPARHLYPLAIPTSRGSVTSRSIKQGQPKFEPGRHFSRNVRFQKQLRNA